MKYLPLVFLLLFGIVAKAQFYDRRTNNTRQYDDSTAKFAIDSLYSLLAKGEKFGNLATKYSQDPGSYKQGGELKPTSMEEYVNEYRKVVLSLSLNEISKPFKSDFGYHVVQLLSKKGNQYVTRHILLRTD